MPGLTLTLKSALLAMRGETEAGTAGVPLERSENVASNRGGQRNISAAAAGGRQGESQKRVEG